MFGERRNILVIRQGGDGARTRASPTNAAALHRQIIGRTEAPGGIVATRAGQRPRRGQRFVEEQSPAQGHHRRRRRGLLEGVRIERHRVVGREQVPSAQQRGPEQRGRQRTPMGCGAAAGRGVFLLQKRHIEQHACLP